MPPKILIIEDHPATAQFISDALTIEGFISITAPDGPTGIAKAKEEKPDLILLDVTMLGLNMFEVCKKLKKDALTSNIPIIIISIWDSEDDKKKGFEAGCVDYIVKPFEVKKLVEAVKKCLSLI